jgi:hypothetical protein
MQAHSARRQLRDIGFGGLGYQVRDAFHPEDLAIPFGGSLFPLGVRYKVWLQETYNYLPS